MQIINLIYRKTLNLLHLTVYQSCQLSDCKFPCLVICFLSSRLGPIASLAVGPKALPGVLASSLGFCLWRVGCSKVGGDLYGAGAPEGLLFCADSCCKILSGIGVLFNPIWVSHDGGGKSVCLSRKALRENHKWFIHSLVHQLIK